MAKVEVKVIEVESTKLDPNAKYIILLDPAEYNLVKYIEEGLIELIGPNFLILPLQASQLKVLEVMPEPKPQAATEIAMQIWKEQNAEKAAMQTQQEASDEHPRTVTQAGEKLFTVNGQDEITTFDGTKVNMNPERAAMQIQQKSSDHYLNQARQHEQR